MINSRYKNIRQVRRNYRNYTPNSRAGNSLSGFKIFFGKLNIFSRNIRFVYAFFRRKFSRTRNKVVRSFFWGRSKSAKYIVQAFIVILIFVFVVTGFNGKPFAPESVQAAGSNQSLVSVDDYSIATSAGETQIPDARKANTILSYTIQSGDTIGGIADRYGISTDTVKNVNNLSSDTLKVGDNLRILPVSGLLHKIEGGETLDSIANKYRISDAGFSSQIIVEWNNMDDTTLIPGTELIVPGGKLEAPKQTYVAQTPYYAPSGPIVDTGNFIRPTQGGGITISQCYRGYAHDGVDLAKVWSGATPNIVASRAGTVTFSGWEGGWTIIIKHSGGFETVYYHMGSPSPRKVGEELNAGDFLGVMGSTGRSTGVHLHFTIRLNGVTINPLSQINLRNSGDLVSC